MKEEEDAEKSVFDQSDEDLISEINQNLRDSKNHLANWRKDARRCFDYYAGRHWDEEDRKILEDTKRHPITFNRIPKIVNAVCGMEIQNRQEVRFLPRQIQDSGVNDTLNEASKWVRDNCDAEDEDSQAFSDTVICGYGWSETYMDYERNPDGDIIISQIDPLEMLYDTYARKKNLSDRKWQAHVKEMSRQEVKRLWPDKAEELAQQVGFDWGDSNGHISDDTKDYEKIAEQKLSKEKKIFVVHYQDYVVIPHYQALNPLTGKLETLNDEDFEKLQKAIENNGFELKYVKIRKRVYRRIFSAGNILLEKSVIDCEDFTFNANTGLHDRNENTFFGLVLLTLDPQMWANKWLSQIMHIINSNAKGGMFYEVGALKNPSKAETDFAKPNAMIELNPGGLDKIQPRDAPRYPEGVDRLLQFAIESINDVAGVSSEFLGLTDRDQNNFIEASRKNQGIMILAPFFDALRRYRKQQGRLLMKYIKDYISDGRLIRVVGEEGAKYVPLIKDSMALQYDVIVDDAPTSPNVKEKVFLALTQMVQLCLSAGIPVPPDVIDYAPLPETLINKWKQTLQPSEIDEQLNQLKILMAKLEAQGKEMDNMKKAADIKKSDSEITLNYAKAQQAHAIGEDESAQAAQKMGIAEQEGQRKDQQMIIDQARKTIDMILTHRRKMTEAQMNAKMKMQQPTGFMQ